MAVRSHRGRWATVAPRLTRSLAAHPHRVAAGVLGLLVLAYLWPALILGHPLLPTALLSSGAPWQASAPRSLLAYYNVDLGDVPISYYPWDVLARQLIHSGTFPAWNPHALAGTPLFANLEVAWLSPFSLPLWVLPLDYGLGVAAALKLWVAGFGTYLLVRELRLGFWPALVAAISFTLCAFNVVWLTYGVFVSVAAWLPWALWLSERIVRDGRSRDGWWLAVVVLLVLVGGHPGTQVHVLAGVALYAAVRTATLAGPDRAQRLRGLGLVGAALAVGGLLAAVVLVPAAEAAKGTFGALLRQDGATALPGTHVPAGALRTALFPEWWGRPVEQFSGGGSYFRERTFYAGAIPLVLAALALFTPGGWRRKAPFALLGVLGALIAVHTPIVYPAVVHLPLFDQIQNQRILLWFLFAVAVLAAFGLEAALAEPASRRVRVVLAVALLAGLAVAATQLGGDGAANALGYVIHRTARARHATLALASVAWWTIFAAALAAVLLLVARRPRGALLAGGLVALLVALDLFHFAAGYNPMGPRALVVPRQTPAVAYLERHRDDGRILGLGAALPADWSTVYGLRDVRGYDAPEPTLRFARLWSLVEATDPSSFASPTPTGLKVLGMLGARYVVADPGIGSSLPELTVAYSGRDATVFENRQALPRAFVPASVEALYEEQTELAAVAAPSFDPRVQAVVPQQALGGAPAPNGGVGTVRVAREGNASVTLDAQLDRPGLVVLDDQYMSGWSVSVDGRPARVVPTDVVLRGVVVPAGRHEVAWRYRVPGLPLGAALSLAGALALLAWGLLLRRSARTASR